MLDQLPCDNRLEREAIRYAIGTVIDVEDHGIEARVPHCFHTRCIDIGTDAFPSCRSYVLVQPPIVVHVPDVVLNASGIKNLLACHS